MNIIRIPDGYYSTERVSRILGINKGTINHWITRGLLKPSIAAPKGKGTRRRYNFVDLVQFKTIKWLREQGMSLQKIRRSVAYLKKNFPNNETMLARSVLITDGKTIFLKNNDKLEDALKDGQLGWTMISIGNMAHEISGRMRELTKPVKATVVVKGKNYSVSIVEDLESGGFVVECPALPGCVSQGDTHKEALWMIKDAIQGYLAAEEDIPELARKSA